MKGNIYIYSSLVEASDIAEASKYEANLYLFLTDSKGDGPKGVAQGNENGPGSVCEQPRGGRLAFVRYIEELDHLPCDPGNGATCQNSEVCTGQVIFLF